MLLNFKDKVVVITGGANGIGMGISMKFAGMNADIVVIDNTEDKFDELKIKFDELKCNFLTIKTDISNRSDIKKSVNKILEKFGKIDCLINNAGINRDMLFVRMKDEDWDRVIDVNLTGTFNMTKSVISHMMKNKYGKIINISSVLGLTGNIGQANYVASKSGIIGFTKSIAREFASRNINCNAVAPGYIVTNMTDKLNNDIKQKILSAIPVKRFGHVDDVANLVCFLCSDYANYITGQVIQIDGGMLI